VNPPSNSPQPTLNLFKGKRIWLTGGTGFKGSWLCEWLLGLGAKVDVFSLPPPTNPSLFHQLGMAKRITWHEGDIRESRAVRNALCKAEPDFVFHLAAQPLVRLSYREPVATYETNVLGTIHVLEALKDFKKNCAVVIVTTDKCYENREWLHGYREEDPLGGHDPYSSSKAACEIAIASWRRSFFHNHPVKIASARAGNVIGGGDWAEDRILPDCIRSLSSGHPIPVRNRTSTRPWQHVLEPLYGYLLLAIKLFSDSSKSHRFDSAFNFGPPLSANRSVVDVVSEALKHWPGEWIDKSDPNAPHEAGKLNLTTEKAYHLLGWQPCWDFETTVQKTVEWYRAVNDGLNPMELTQRNIQEYQSVK
jgi:CDP-glucose 4,6-dehydratase